MLDMLRPTRTSPLLGSVLRNVPCQDAESVVAQLKRQLVEIGDQVRERLGRDLHDSLCQLLVSLSCELRLLRSDLQARGLPESARAERIELRLRETMQLARRFAHGLYPVDLPGNMLGFALQKLACDTSQDFGLKCTAECSAVAAAMEPMTATHLYRIAQEAVHNAVKHADP